MNPSSPTAASLVNQMECKSRPNIGPRPTKLLLRSRRSLHSVEWATRACQAIEDADCLATHLVRLGGDRDTALRAYTDLRIPRATTIQHRVQSWGELLHADGLLRDVRNALLQDRSPTDYRHLDWLYATPPDKAAP